MGASRVEDDPSMLYIRLVDPRIRSKQTAFYSEDEARHTSDYLVRLPKNEFAQLGGETILRRNLLRLSPRQDRGERNDPPFGNRHELARYHEDVTVSKVVSDKYVGQRCHVELRIHPWRSHRSY